MQSEEIMPSLDGFSITGRFGLFRGRSPGNPSPPTGVEMEPRQTKRV